MKMYKLFNLTLLTLLMIGFNACNEDNEIKLSFSSSEVTLLPSDQTTVSIRGGASPYKVISSDETVATATVQNDELSISSKKLGNTILTVTDKNNNIGELAVTVKEKIEVILVQKYEALINASDTQVAEKITEELMKDVPVAENGQYQLLYKLPSEGELTVYPTPDKKDPKTGTFTKTRDNGLHYIFKYDNKEFDYFLYEKRHDTTVKSANQNITNYDFMLVTDLTESYQQQYPEAGIKQILFGPHIKISNMR